ncbi:Ms5788A family Cys-rich leader peptide [Dactylosporangium sp. CS-047395]|uniref:Ms5788A family Cys-rich leader peptide n=1 Tax=Dactylosporangium sp. CS-047395 TaxID=3239936 RepID=UPI003D8F8F1D
MRACRSRPRPRTSSSRISDAADPGRARSAMLGCRTMSMLLTKRRAVDLCRVATCLCCRP